MAIDLKNLQPTKISKNLKGKYVLIYGPPKIGKTSLAVKFPKSLLLAFEPGHNALVNQMVQPVNKWTEFRQVVKQLDDPEMKKQFDTIVIDTTDIAWTYCEQYICASNPLDSGMIPKALIDIPWGKGYDLCIKEYDEQFRRIAMLGYGMVFISHEQMKMLKDEKGEEYTKFMPTLPNRPRLIINRFVDIIGYLRNVVDEDGVARRYMFTRDSAIYEAGSRFRFLSPKFPLTYEALTEEIYKAIDEEVKDSGGEVTNDFVNSYAVNTSSFDNLMEEAKQIWETNITKGDGIAEKMLDIVEHRFGRRMKLSEATPEHLDTLEAVVSDLKNL